MKFEIIVKIDTDTRNFDLLVKDAAPGLGMSPEEFKDLMIWCIDEVSKNVKNGNCTPMIFEEDKSQGISN